MTAVSPATLQILPNAYYKSSEDYTWALAEAIRDEYRAIVDAGFILQIDDPALVDIYDWWFSMNDDIAGYRKWATFQVEALNHALQGIPEIACGSTFAGGAGTARTKATSNSRTWSICCLK
jgi:5-methyltetrahydropteroyltriglutamate--homocysteine methyltransferase